MSSTGRKGNYSSKNNKSGKKHNPVYRILFALVGFVILVGILRLNGVNSIEDLIHWAKDKGEVVATCMKDGKPQPDCLNSNGANSPSSTISSGSSSAHQGGSNSTGQGNKHAGKPSTANKPSTPSKPQPNAPGANNNPATVDSYTAKLAAIPVKPAEKVNYKRSNWKHWSLQETGCNTRDEVLKQQGKNVVTAGPCKVTEGTWKDLYSGEIITSAKKVDIDHIAPLKWVAEHGGYHWTPDQKEEYANNTKLVLWAVSARENRKKGASGPKDYMPVPSFQCEYSERYIDIVTRYHLWLEAGDVTALKKGLATCK